MVQPRRLALILQVALLAFAAASPAWAAGEGGGGFQSWLVEHRPLLWKVFYLQLAIFVALGAWEAVFQVQRKKQPLSRLSMPSDEQAAADPLASADPFKTQATTRKSASPPPPAPGPPPSLAQIARGDAEEPRGARRLDRIESGDTVQALPRRASSPSPAGAPPAPSPSSAVPPPPPPPPADGGGDSWADVLKRTTQEGGERPQRRPVQIPPPAARSGPRIDAPPRRPEPEPEPAESAPSGLSDDDMVAPRPAARTVRPGAAPPAPAAPVGGGVRLPAGTSRYAWDHALQLLQSSAVGVCRLVPGGATSGGLVAGPSATLNLVTPPPAAAEKKRGRGMKLAAGGETRLGETYGRTTPILPMESDPVPGFTGIIQSTPPPPAALQPVKRVGESTTPPPPPPPGRSLSPPTTRMVPGMRLEAGGSGEIPIPPRPPEAPPVRPVTPPAAPMRPPLSPPTTRMGPGGPPVPPPAPRRSLDMPTRRIELEPKTADALREAARGGSSGEMPSAADVPPRADPSIQKENPDALRKSEGSPKILEIPKGSREKRDDQGPDPNDP